MANYFKTHKKKCFKNSVVSRKSTVSNLEVQAKRKEFLVKFTQGQTNLPKQKSKSPNYITIYWPRRGIKEFPGKPLLREEDRTHSPLPISWELGH